MNLSKIETDLSGSLEFIWEYVFSKLHALPSNALSISLCVGTGLFLRRAYIDITIPGVQNPHWDPWDLAIRSLTLGKNKTIFTFLSGDLCKYQRCLNQKPLLLILDSDFISAV